MYIFCSKSNLRSRKLRVTNYLKCLKGKLDAIKTFFLKYIEGYKFLTKVSFSKLSTNSKNDGNEKEKNEIKSFKCV